MYAGRHILLALSTFVVLASGKLTFNNVGKQTSRRPPAGSYYLQNVKTGERMTYFPDSAHSFFPMKGKGSAVQMKYTSSGGDKLAVFSPGERSKCWSAQWGVFNNIGRDWAAALYDCAVVGFNGKKAQAFQGNERDGPVRPAKQMYWVADTRKGHKIVAVDHAHDMPLRCLTGKTVRATFNKKIRMARLDPCVAGDRSQDWLFIKA